VSNSSTLLDVGLPSDGSRAHLFVGASGLLWLSQFTPGSTRSAEPAELARSSAWIVAGCIAAVIFVGILGPGIH